MRNRKILEDIKVLKANRKTLKQFAKDKYVDSEGYANIHIYVDEVNLYNPMTNPSNPELSNEIIDQIEKESYYIPSEYPIKVILHSKKDLNDMEIARKLKDHYWKQLADKDDDLKKNNVLSAALFTLGLLFLSAFFVLQNIPDAKDLFNEIFSIIGSFAVWESADLFLLNRSRLKIEYLNIAQLALLTLIISDNEK